MEENNSSQSNPRRKFLGALAAGAAGVGLAMSLPVQLHAKTAEDNNDVSEADAWFNKVKGKHRIMYDVPRPNEMMPFAWPRIFLLTNEHTGSPASDCGVVVVLRHEGIPYAFDDWVWAKYNFAEVFKGVGELGPAFKAADAATAVKTRNPFAHPAKGDFQVPVFGAVSIGINELQADGVMFCVCDAAVTVYSAVVAMQGNMNADDVKKDWMKGLLPGIQPVPSGVWAVGRAQEHKCAYCYAG